ncbi:MAG: hypothetical protein M3Y79_12020 [Pseudomonadota bacterium]|nr:hypothetical protein [Pseudomonadota bacterium]
MNSSTRMMMIGLLALTPVLASARSEYAQCLAEQNQQRALRSFDGFRPAGRSARPTYPRYYSSLDYGYGFSGTYAYSYPTRFISDGYADVLTVMVRACRQYKEKPEPPKFRVFGVKSPALDRAGNRPQDGDSQ